MTYYCHKCASTNLSITPSIPYNLTGTQYQLDKFMKHTAPIRSIRSIRCSTIQHTAKQRLHRDDV